MRKLVHHIELSLTVTCVPLAAPKCPKIIACSQAHSGCTAVFCVCLSTSPTHHVHTLCVLVATVVITCAACHALFAALHSKSVSST